MIELVQVRKVYNPGRPDEAVAVDGVSLAIRRGTVAVFRGPSGSGKSSLLALLGAMARPTSGRIRVFGQEITSLPERFLTQVRRRTFGFVFQQPHLVRGLSAAENVMLPAYPLGPPRAALARRALALLAQLGLAARAGARVEQLSGGEAQRVAIARALVNEAEVLVADEPTAHLDRRAARELMEIVGGLRARGTTVVIASHDPVVHQAAAVDQAFDLRDGRLEGAP